MSISVDQLLTTLQFASHIKLKSNELSNEMRNQIAQICLGRLIICQSAEEKKETPAAEAAPLVAAEAAGVHRHPAAVVQHEEAATPRVPRLLHPQAVCTTCRQHQMSCSAGHPSPPPMLWLDLGDRPGCSRALRSHRSRPVCSLSAAPRRLASTPRCCACR